MHLISARTKRNTLEKQESIKTLRQSAGSIARAFVSITIIRVELLDLSLVNLAVGLKANGAAEIGLGLIVAKFDKVAVLAANIDAIREMIFADIHHIDVVLLLLAVLTSVAGGEDIELMLVSFGWLVCARKAEVACLGGCEESSQGEDGVLHDDVALSLSTSVFLGEERCGVILLVIVMWMDKRFLETTNLAVLYMSQVSHLLTGCFGVMLVDW